MTALRSAPDGKMTLGDIYEWIIFHFPYYKNAGPSWKVCLSSLWFQAEIIGRTRLGTTYHSASSSKRFHGSPDTQARVHSGQSTRITLKLPKNRATASQPTPKRGRNDHLLSMRFHSTTTSFTIFSVKLIISSCFTRTLSSIARIRRSHSFPCILDQSYLMVYVRFRCYHIHLITP